MIRTSRTKALGGFCAEHGELMRSVTATEVRVRAIETAVLRMEKKLDERIAANGEQNVHIARVEERAAATAKTVARNWGLVAGAAISIVGQIVLFFPLKGG